MATTKGPGFGSKTKLGNIENREYKCIRLVRQIKMTGTDLISSFPRKRESTSNYTYLLRCYVICAIVLIFCEGNMWGVWFCPYFTV